MKHSLTALLQVNIQNKSNGLGTYRLDIAALEVETGMTAVHEIMDTLGE